MSEDDESKRGTQRALTLIGTAVLVAFIAAVGLYSFLKVMATPLHTNAADVPTVSQADVAQGWEPAVQKARQIATAFVVEQNLPGLSVAVGTADDVVWAEGFGWADLSSRVPLSPAMRFRIGHASKTLTSAAVGVLYEQGRLDLDADIQKYVPAFPEKPWPITLRQLMGHVAGVRHYESEEDYMPTGHCDRAAAGVSHFAEDPLRFQPESQYGYSTFGWILVSAAVEAAANESFASFMNTRVLQPLGMRDTTTDVGTQPMPNRATFYYPRLSGDTIYGPEPATAVDYSCFAGAGAYLSTPSDLVRFGLAMNRGTLLKPDTVKMLQTPQQLLSGEKTEYGLGWMLETFPLAGQPTPIAGHASRTLLGGSASFMVFPERDLVVAVMSNTSLAKLRTVTLDVAQTFARQQTAPAGSS